MPTRDEPTPRPAHRPSLLRQTVGGAPFGWWTSRTVELVKLHASPLCVGGARDIHEGRGLPELCASNPSMEQALLAIQEHQFLQVFHAVNNYDLAGHLRA